MNNESAVKKFRPLRDELRKIFERSKEKCKQQSLIDKCKALYRDNVRTDIFLYLLCGTFEVKQRISEQKRLEYLPLMKITKFYTGSFLSKLDMDNDNFLKEFKTALRYSLVYPEKEAVDNILSFVARFIVLLYATESNKSDLDLSDTISEECTFPNAILELLFRTHGASMMQVRLRCLQLINKILSGMPENSTISDCIWVKLKETVLYRIQDKSPVIRVQAVLTARKLQDPKNSNCEIIKAFVFHLNDPSSAVRRTIVSSIAFNKLTIGHVLARTRDVNDNVRRNTYIVFSKVRVLNLTINYRLTILERGLQDRSAMVRNCVQSVLLVNWLENFNNDVLKFLEALDVINSMDSVLKIMEGVMKVLPRDEIVKMLCLNEDSRLIPAEKLTPEMALLWRVVARKFYEEKMEENLEKVLPNITVFCDYIRSLYPLDKNKSLNMSQDEKWEEVKEKEILRHLLELIKVFDLADELGRSNLKKLIFDMLSSERIGNDLIECLIELVALVIPNPKVFHQEVTEIISELREPLVVENIRLPLHKELEMEINISDLKVKLNDLREKEFKAVLSKDYCLAEKMKAEIERTEEVLKSLSNKTCASQEVREEKNDPVTVCKCLTIIEHMIKYSKVRTLTPTLLNIKENFLNQCLTSQDLLTQSLSIKVLGQFCVLDLDLAKENLFRFILMLSETGEDEINEPALKSTFDILLYHGIEPFQKLHKYEIDEDQKPANKGRDVVKDEDISQYEPPIEPDMYEGTKFIPVLLELLNCKSNDLLKSIAFEGLCKLLLSGSLYSAKILQKIIIKGFSPIIDNETEDYIRQMFMVFFPAFASATPRSQEMIEAAFVPILKELIQAPVGTPEADINIKDVATFLILYTIPDTNKKSCMTLHVHNNLAMLICHELLKGIDLGDETECCTLYLKLLMQLKLSFDSETFYNQICVLTNKIKKELNDRTLLRLLNEFRKKIDEGYQNVQASVEKTLPVVGENEQNTVVIKKESVVDDMESVKSRNRKSNNEKVLEDGEETEDDSADSVVFPSPSYSNENKVNFVPESPDMAE